MREREQDGIGFVCGQWPLDAARSTIVFIHGSGGSSLLWRAQVEGLGGRVNTVALDLPGHGRSGGAALDSVPGYARAVAAFIEAIGAPAPIACGLSLGGAVAMQLLLDHAGRFKAGILVSTGARLRVLPAIFDGIRNDFPAFVSAIGRMGFSPATPEALKQPFLEDKRRGRPEVAFGDFSACDRFDVIGRLSEIDVPVLVVTAADDQLTPPKYGDFLEKGIAGAARARIPEAGHMVPIEKPEEVNDAIRNFLDDRGL
jgi:pimeloyl-ACP methyl ester carboxylesterase